MKVDQYISMKGELEGDLEELSIVQEKLIKCILLTYQERRKKRLFSAIAQICKTTHAVQVRLPG
jgi:hypothetical protein